MTLEILAVAMAISSFFSGGNTPVDNRHFLLYGKTLELEVNQGFVPVDTEGVQVVIYQDDEIYAAFNSEGMGDYKFNLPIGFVYEIVYGGEQYVNKSILINTRTLSKSRDGHIVEVNMALFKGNNAVDFSVFEEPVALFYCDENLRTLAPDMQYAEEQGRKVNRVMKKFIKSMND